MDKKIPDYINYCCGKLLKKNQEIGECINKITIEVIKGNNTIIKECELELGFLLRDSLSLCQSIIDYSFVAVTGKRNFNLGLPIGECLDFTEQELSKPQYKNIPELEAPEILEKIFLKSFENFELKMKIKVEKKNKVPFNFIFQKFLYKFTGIPDALYPPEQRRDKIKYFDIKNSHLILFSLINYYKHVGFAKISYKHGDVQIEWNMEINNERRVFSVDANRVKQFIYNCASFGQEAFIFQD